MTPGLRVFVVEDEPPARDYLQSLLVAAGMQVTGASGDADEAISLIDASRPDVVFLDVRLRSGDGLSVLRGLSHSPHIIFTTAYEAHAVAAFELGAFR